MFTRSLSFRARRQKSGFTLIELLTVIAIIGILAAIIIPVVGRVRTSAAAAKSASNLRQLGLALNSFIGETGRVTTPRNFDDELARYLGFSVGTNGQYAMAAENFFTHPREDSTPRVAGAPRRSYAQNSQWGSGAEGLYESVTLGKRANKIPNPSQVMIYTERTGPGNPGGVVGLDTYTGIWCGNHNPAESNADWAMDINGAPGVFNYCFLDAHVERRRFDEVRMIGRGSIVAPRGAWTITEGD